MNAVTLDPFDAESETRVDLPKGFPEPYRAPERAEGEPTTIIGRLLDLLRGDGRDYDQSRRLLARSVVLNELAPPGATQRLMWLISILVAGFAIWASVIELDEVASAPGEIAPIAQVQPVEHLEGGIVSKINVLDGQLVKRGDVLVTLDGGSVRADLARARARRDALTLQSERLVAFSTGRAPRFDRDVRRGLVTGETEILAAQTQSRDAQLSVVDAQTAGKRGDIAVLQDREDSLRRQVALLQQDMSARKPLVDKGLISALSYLALERDLTRLQGDLAETSSQKRRAYAALQEASRSKAEVAGRLRVDAMHEYGDVASQLAQVDEEVKRLEDQAARLAVRAPVDGVVKGLAAISVRQVIQPGGVIAEVVPQAGPIVAIVRISPADIGHVKVGSPVNVKVATFDYARNGGIDGVVDYVSAGSFVDQEGHTYFKARIRLKSNHVGPAARGLFVTSGMTVVADVKTGSKTLTEYLFKPVTNALKGSFTER